MLFVSVGVTSIVQWSVFVQGKERGVEQYGVVILHDNPLVLCLDPWLVLIGCTAQRRGETEEALGQMEQLEGTNVSIFNTLLWARTW